MAFLQNEWKRIFCRLRIEPRALEDEKNWVHSGSRRSDDVGLLEIRCLGGKYKCRIYNDIYIYVYIYIWIYDENWMLMQAAIAG